MVHYRPLNGIFDSRNLSDYWKLRRPNETRENIEQYLTNQGIPFSRNTDTPRLLALLERHQLGFIQYDSCSTAELSKFASTRKLDTSSLPKKPKSPTRLALIALLEQADKDLTFTKILDLPPELRLRIYEHHYDSFDRLCLSGPTPPPITQVCSLIRQESLPLFFSVNRFCFQFHVTNYFSRQSTRTGAVAPPIAIDAFNETERFLRNMPNDWFGMLRRVRISVLGLDMGSLDINIGKGTAPSTFEIRHLGSRAQDPSATRSVELEQRVSELVEAMDEKGGDSRFGEEYVQRFVEICTDVQDIE